MDTLLLVICRVEEEQEEPAPPNVIPTFDTTAMLMSVCKRATQDQPQHSLGQFSSQVSEHVSGGVDSVVFLVKFFDGVRKLFHHSQREAVKSCQDLMATYCGDVCDVVGRKGGGF